jgi:hypothetical protein
MPRLHPGGTLEFLSLFFVSLVIFLLADGWANYCPPQNHHLIVVFMNDYRPGEL